MGFLSKRERIAPAITTDNIEDAPAITSIDAEKGHGALHESAAAPVSSHRVDPEIEKAVVRKLDWRVPPLLGALCMF